MNNGNNNYINNNNSKEEIKNLVGLPDNDIFYQRLRSNPTVYAIPTNLRASCFLTKIYESFAILGVFLF